MEVAGFDAIASQWGIFAALFVSLLVYVIKQNEKREKEYQEFIKTLQNDISVTTSASHSMIEEITGEVDTLDVKLNEMSAKVDVVDQKVEHLINKVDHLNERI